MIMMRCLPLFYHLVSSKGYSMVLRKQQYWFIYFQIIAQP